MTSYEHLCVLHLEDWSKGLYQLVRTQFCPTGTARLQIKEEGEVFDSGENMQVIVLKNETRKREGV